MRVRLAGGAASHGDEAGITLIEVMVALLLLTVVLSGLASVMITSVHALHGQEKRVRANALANELLEGLRDLDWDEIGFSDDDHGFRAAVDVATGDECDADEVGTAADCEATVVFDDADDVPDGDRPLPLRDGEGGTALIERDGIEYEARTDITWVDHDSTSFEQDFVRFTVELTWADLDTERTVRHQATRTPTGGERDFSEGDSSEGDSSEFAISGVDVDPALGYLHDEPGTNEHGTLSHAVDADAETSDPIDGATVTLTTTTPADDVTVTFEGRTNASGSTGPEGGPTTINETLTLVDGSDGTEWALSSNDTEWWRYLNGDTVLEFSAGRDEDAQPVTSTTTVRYVMGTVEFDDGHPQVSHAEVCVDNQHRLTHEVEVSARVRGLTHDDAVRLSGSAVDEELETPAETSFASSTPSASLYERTLEVGHQMPRGNAISATLEVEAERVFDTWATTRAHAAASLTININDDPACAP